VLIQYPAPLMVAYEVSVRVNAVRNNDVRLVQPADQFRLAAGQ